MKKIVFYIWQLPQNFLAIIVWGVLRVAGKIVSVESAVTPYKNIIVKIKPGIGVSLGLYIFVRGNASRETVLHEQGHTGQSEKLGWLYLPVIGIYSAVFCNLLDRLFHKKWPSEKRQKWYYSRWTECWADKLGGVERKSLDWS